MGFNDIFKRFAGLTVLRLLGINDLREQLSQSPRVTSRPGGAAILAAHLYPEKQNAHDSVLPHRTLSASDHIGAIS